MIKWYKRTDIVLDKKESPLIAQIRRRQHKFILRAFAIVVAFDYDSRKSTSYFEDGEINRDENQRTLQDMEGFQAYLLASGYEQVDEEGAVALLL